MVYLPLILSIKIRLTMLCVSGFDLYSKLSEELAAPFV